VRIGAGFNAKETWLVVIGNGKFWLGNSDQHPLPWPPDDPSNVEKWTLCPCPTQLRLVHGPIPARASDHHA